MQMIDERMKAVNSAQLMSRLTLSASLVLSTLILVSQFNAYYSLYRQFALYKLPELGLQEQGERDLKRALTIDQDRIAANREKVAEQWIAGRAFTIPFIDIPIMPSDIPMVGGVALGVTTLFLVFYVRREHLSIAHLLKDASRSDDQELQASIVHAVLSGCIFVTFSRRAEAYKDLKEVPILPTMRREIHWVSIGLIVLPVITLLISIGIDIHSYFFVISPFRGTVPAVNLPHNGLEFALRCLIALIPAAWTGYHCFSCLDFQTATGRLLTEFVEGVERKQSDTERDAVTRGADGDTNGADGEKATREGMRGHPSP